MVTVHLPKITPPGVVLLDMLDIIMPAIEQDITTQYGKHLVKVIYHVFSKDVWPMNDVAVVGDITYVSSSEAANYYIKIVPGELRSDTSSGILEALHVASALPIDMCDMVWECVQIVGS